MLGTHNRRNECVVIKAQCITLPTEQQTSKNDQGGDSTHDSAPYRDRVNFVRVVHRGRRGNQRGYGAGHCGSWLEKELLGEACPLTLCVTRCDAVKMEDFQ